MNIICGKCNHEAPLPCKIAEAASKTFRCTKCQHRQKLDLASIVAAIYAEANKEAASEVRQ